jgi:ribosomal-protein-alanine N-acetyltransferase
MATYSYDHSHKKKGMGFMLFTDLDTERLWLKSIAMEDKEFIFSQFSNDTVNKHLFDAEPMKVLAEAEELIRFYRMPEPRGQHRWIIVRKEDGTKMGTCGFHCYDKLNRRTEMGYDLYPSYWGRGYMLEAMRVIISFAKAHMDVNEMNACIHAENQPSIRLIEKLGFIRTGSEQVAFRGKEYQHFRYSLYL